MSDLNITGEFNAMPITDAAAAPFARLAALDMTDALVLSGVDVVEVEAPGHCLIELPDGFRYLLRMKSGRIAGPARLLEVDDPIKAPDHELLTSTGSCIPVRPQQDVAASGRGETLRGVLAVALGLTAVGLSVLGKAIPLTEQDQIVAVCLAVVNVGLAALCALPFQSGLRAPAGADHV